MHAVTGRAQLREIRARRLGVFPFAGDGGRFGRVDEFERVTGPARRVRGTAGLEERLHVGEVLAQGRCVLLGLIEI